ncbi:MAG: dihydroneopterin aldolase [Verrucomicrobiota bacterium]
MDTITIHELEVFYRVGVPEAERAQAQRLLLTVAMEHPFPAAVATDDLTKTIDYYAVSRRLLHFGEDRSWKLIETLACDLATLILQDYGPQRVTVEVKKFILPEARWVAVKVER